MRKYAVKKKRARKKNTLSQKEPSKREKRKKVRVAEKRETKATKRSKKKARAPKKRTAAKKPVAKKRTRAKTTAKRAAKRAARSAPKRGAGTRRKKSVKRSAAQKTPVRKRGIKNAKIRAKVTKAEKLREKSRGKTLTPTQRRRLKAAAEAERKAAEASRLFEERLRQHREEQQAQTASKKRILTTLQKQFSSLIREAMLTNQLPHAPRSKVIDSDRFKGRKQSISIRRVLDEAMVEEIMYRARKASQSLPHKKGMGWLGTINFASLGESLIGYGQIILRSTLPGASMFQVQSIVSTGIQNTREGMLMKLEEELDVLASEKTATVFINFVVVQCYGRQA